MKYLSKKRGLSGENLPETLLWFSASLATFRRVARGFAEIPQAPALQYEGNHISCQIYDICYKYITKIYINIQNISNHYIWYDDVHILRANRNAYKQTCFKDLQRAFFFYAPKRLAVWHEHMRTLSASTCPSNTISFNCLMNLWLSNFSYLRVFFLNANFKQACHYIRWHPASASVGR